MFQRIETGVAPGSAAVLIYILVACGSGPTTNSAGDELPDAGVDVADAAPAPDASGPEPDAGPPPSDAGAMDATAPDSGSVDVGSPGIDGNDDFSEAATLRRSVTDPVAGRIDAWGDRDYFRFEGSAGEWIRIETSANRDGDPTLVDTVITLYGEDRRQLAESDDLFPRSRATDSRIWTRLPRDGTYFVSVEDWGSATGAPERPLTDRSYTISLSNPDPSNAFVVEDAELGDDGSTANVEPNFTQTSLLILGRFDHPGDVDVFRFPIDTPGGLLLRTAVFPQGTEGMGSSTVASRVELRTSTSTGVVAARTPSAAGTELYPPVETDRGAEVWIRHGEGELAANAFYVVTVSASPGFREEQDDVGNGTLDGAESLSGWLRAGNARVVYLEPRLGEGDVDVFMGEAELGDRVSVNCGARSLGSGILGLEVELFDAGQQPVISAVETETDSAAFGATRVPEGPFYIRLSKQGQDPEVQGVWATCGVGIFR